MTYPTFAEKARHLTAHHPPRTPDVAAQLDEVRSAFACLVDRVADYVPDGADATIAARAIADACQATIAAIVRNQDDA